MKDIGSKNIKRKTMVLIIILIITIINMCPIISNAVETNDITGEETKDLVEITFKDEVLYNAIAKNLKNKIESKTDSTKTIKMTKENLESITFILVIGEDSNKVVDITGIEKFTNLTQLILSSNQISDISALKDLTNLTELDLNSNQISDISPLEGILGTAEIFMVGERLKAETIDNTHKVQLPIIFEQTKELIDKGYGQYKFEYIGCTLNSDGKSVTIDEGTELATAWISNSHNTEHRISLNCRFEIVDKYKPTQSEDKGNKEDTKGEEKKQDPTEAIGKLPYAGKSIIVILMIIVVSIIAIILKIKKDKYNGIK